MSIPHLLKKLDQLQKERRRLLRRVAGSNPLAVGSVSVVQRKCGNPHCRCSQGKGHPQTLFLFKDTAGKRRCKLIRRADEQRILKAGLRYRMFRQALKELRAIDKREKQILMALRDARAIDYV
jgi:hypothetical protein